MSPVSPVFHTVETVIIGIETQLGFRFYRLFILDLLEAQGLTLR